jgi:endonuclease/exonuclease/phosphatase family metal-dependent hydrolase
MTMRVLTFNLWARHGEWDQRRRVIRAGLHALNADLITFQEAIVDDNYDQGVDLLGADYHVVHQRTGLVGDGRHHGVCIASRWPVVEVDDVDLHVTARTGDYSCGTLVARVAAPEPFGSVLLVNHGPSWAWSAELEREKQAVAAARAVADIIADRPAHVVVGGDFNATPDTASMRFWTGRRSLEGTSVAYRDAWDSVHGDRPGSTFDPENPLTAHDEPGLDRGRRIDYLLVGCGPHGPTLKIDNCEVVFAAPDDGVWASDHFGVVADLNVHPIVREVT